MTAKKIQSLLRQLADPENADKAARFFKTGAGEYGEGDRFLGIRVPVLRKHVATFNDLTTADFDVLLSSGFHEERMFALLAMVRSFQRGDESNRTLIYNHYLANTRYINNWDLVDCSAYQIVGSYLQDGDRETLACLARSSNLWERRIAMMATYQFIRSEDYATTLELAKILLTDEHDLIHKVVGWMLREVGNRDRAVEEAFLVKHYRDMPRTMLRYAIEKFPPEQRKAYLNGSVAPVNS